MSNYCGVLAFRVCLCIKILGDSSFQGLPVREAFGGLYFYGCACASSYWGILLLLALVLVVLLLLLQVLLLIYWFNIHPKHAPSCGDSGSLYIKHAIAFAAPPRPPADENIGKRSYPLQIYR